MWDITHNGCRTPTRVGYCDTPSSRDVRAYKQTHVGLTWLFRVKSNLEEKLNESL